MYKLGPTVGLFGEQPKKLYTRKLKLFGAHVESEAGAQNEMDRDKLSTLKIMSFPGCCNFFLT